MGRNGLHEVPASSGATLLWDRRFEVKIPERQGALSIAALARSERRFRSSAEKSVIQALPGLYQDGTLVAVPESVLAVDEGASLDRLAVECIVGERLGIAARRAQEPR